MSDVAAYADVDTRKGYPYGGLEGGLLGGVPLPPGVTWRGLARGALPPYAGRSGRARPLRHLL